MSGSIPGGGSQSTKDGVLLNEQGNPNPRNIRMSDFECDDRFVICAGPSRSLEFVRNRKKYRGIRTMVKDLKLARLFVSFEDAYQYSLAPILAGCNIGRCRFVTDKSIESGVRLVLMHENTIEESE